jgi:bacteriocin-like protein
MRELTEIPMNELTDTELEAVSGGCVTVPVLEEGNGHLNFHANSPNTPANGNGFNGNGASIVLI